MINQRGVTLVFTAKINTKYGQETGRNATNAGHYQ